MKIIPHRPCSALTTHSWNTTCTATLQFVIFIDPTVLSDLYCVACLIPGLAKVLHLLIECNHKWSATAKYRTLINVFIVHNNPYVQSLCVLPLLEF